MSEKAVLNTLDNLLLPYGFTRRKTSWNRRSADFIEVIDLQLSKAGGTATINAGVLDTKVHVALWGTKTLAFVDEATCTVRSRVGELMDGKDRWWRLDEDQATAQISEAVASHVLPFVERMCSRHAMVQWLTEAQVVKKRYPLPILNLAILQRILGHSLEGCELLAKLRESAIGAWRERAKEVAERLGCAT